LEYGDEIEVMEDWMVWLAETLGTRVQIEPRERGGRIWIDYFSHEELLALSIAIRKAGEEKTHKGMFDKLREEDMEALKQVPNTPREVRPVTEEELTHLRLQVTPEEVRELVDSAATQVSSEAIEEDIFDEPEVAVDDRSLDDVKAEEQNEDLYNVSKFTV
jgi:hypothetical protein